jgi:hypothetical protein
MGRRLIIFGIMTTVILIFAACGKDSVTNDNINPDTTIPGRFLNYSIDKTLNGIKTYDFKNINLAAESYRASGMRWFVPSGTTSFDLDSNLVPVIHYSFGDHYNPVSTCHVAFGFYKYIMEGPSEYSRKGFINNVEWLMANCDKNYYLHYDFDFDHGAGIIMEDGWISAMAQGEALAAVSMAYNLTKDKRYLTAARGFFKTLYVNKGDYWCFGVDDNGYYWLEEYPNKDFCHVLNGFLFGLWGIWDYYLISNDEFALQLFSAGVKSVADNYKIWKIYGIDASRYCIHRTIKDENYHSIHLSQLESYATLFNIKEFKDAIAYFRSTTVTPEIKP